jgi:DNA-binding FadR family transcriptional regulator
MTESRRETLAERAAGALLARIRSGEWTIGARLPGETTLAPQLGVGRSTVREAIRLLSARGVLQPRQGAGVFLSALNIGEEWEILLRRANIVSVLEVRIAIESEAAELAAVRRSDDDLRRMRRGLQHLAEAGEDPDLHVTAELEFHRAAVAAAKNTVMLELYEGFAPAFAQSIADTRLIRGRVHRDPSQDPHERLVDRIEARDSAGASRTIRMHLGTLKDSLH